MTDSVSSIELELQQVTGILPRRLPRQDYLFKLVEKASNLPDTKWGELTSETQRWVNAGIKIYNKDPDADIPDFPEDVDEATEPATREEPSMAKQATATRTATRARPVEDEEVTTTATKKVKSAKVETKADGKKAKDEGEPHVSASSLIKEFLMEDPEMSAADLEEKLRTKGLTLTRISISTVRSDFRHSLKALKAAGHLKGSIRI